jgi:hypothetical protein
MENDVLNQIESLRRAGIAELRRKYQEVFQEEIKCKHRQHVFRRIAWRLQELAEGGVSHAVTSHNAVSGHSPSRRPCAPSSR